MGNSYKTVVSFILLAFSLTGCGGGFSSPGQLKTASLDQFSTSAKFDCQYIGVQALRSRLSSALGIIDQDIPVLDDKGRPTQVGRIESNKNTLGEADPQIGKYADYSCEMAKFKISVEIMIDACKQALVSEEIKQKLFPLGASNFDHLYLTFIGRVPSDSESAVLADLSASLPEGLKEAGACSAAAMSFEALTRI